MICRLCQTTEGVRHVSAGNERNYFLCPNCSLINLDSRCFMDEAREKQRYLTHNNGIEHKGYVDFLYRAITPALQFLRRGMTGLDYGCGHEPTLFRLLEAHGYPCENYDPFFVEHALDKKFNFIFATEVFEHFFYPDRDILRLKSLLHKKGLLIVMTERWDRLEHFSGWYYTKDPTHVCFYHSRTFDFIRENFEFEKLYDDGQKLLILKMSTK